VFNGRNLVNLLMNLFVSDCWEEILEQWRQLA